MSCKCKIHPDQYTDYISELSIVKCSVDNSLSSEELYGDCLRGWLAKAIVDNNADDVKYILQAGFPLGFLHLNLVSLHHWLAQDPVRHRTVEVLLEYDPRVTYPAYAYCRVPDTAQCLTHWPPREGKRNRPAASRLPAHADLAVLEYWERMGKLRRMEARRLISHNWDIVKKWVVMRSVVFWLMGKAQERLCAPGGGGRLADERNYRLQFVS